MSRRYHQLEREIEKKIIYDNQNHIRNLYRALDETAIRRDMSKDKSNVLRPAYARDIDKILHLPLYNRYNDKTQVFSFYHNDDITRRGLHVQLVSRIARTIGRMLGLNLDLIEAIALGHDIGHTPFGHAGERFLSEILQRETGRYFNHNVHSVRVLDVLYRNNISLQVLDGILCHNGEVELNEYKKSEEAIDFVKFDYNVEECYTKGMEAINRLLPCTLEGCVVRVSDIIAYIGKDRQDAMIAKIIDEKVRFSSDYIGNKNAEMINNLIVDIVNNSYGKESIQLSPKAFQDLKVAKDENYSFIYRNKAIRELYDEKIKPMFEELYYKLLLDVKNIDESSAIYKYHIAYIEKNFRHCGYDYRSEEANQIVVDYIASMTDDYFIQLHKLLFPESKCSIEYKSYFEV